MRRRIAAVILSLALVTGCASSRVFSLSESGESSYKNFEMAREAAELTLKEKNYQVEYLEYKTEDYLIIKGERTEGVGLFAFLSPVTNYHTQIRIKQKTDDVYRYAVSSKMKVQRFLDFFYFFRPWERRKDEEKGILGGIERRVKEEVAGVH